MYSFFEITNLAVGLLFTVFYSYQMVYIAIALLFRKRVFTAKTNHKYGVFIAARNERLVIAQLIESLRKQDYPSDLVDIYVIADNCTDDTAEVARNAGATVFERFSKTEIGKGYALDYGFAKLMENGKFDEYDGFMVFDADNLLEENFITEMNKLFDSGYRIVTSYRNSKNFDTNWISAGSSLWYLREAKLVNRARMIIHTSSAISGTGFLVAREIIAEKGGWKYFLLTEDIEFSIDNIIKKEKIGFAEDAMLYDEQPYTFKASWNQRIRWAKGFLQIGMKYGWKLFVSIFKNLSFSSYDLFMTVFPAMIFSIVGLLVNTFISIYSLIAMPGDPLALQAGLAAIGTFTGFYGLLFFLGVVTTIVEWKKIKAPVVKKIGYLFTFPIFIFTYIPISIAALFKKIEWKPIEHNITRNIDDMHKKV